VVIVRVIPVRRKGMLILCRKRGESIMIGDDVEVRIVDIGDGKVRLGITGPSSVPVHQRERYEAILQKRTPLISRPDQPLPVT
jgi:carbon storage regulator